MKSLIKIITIILLGSTFSFSSCSNETSNNGSDSNTGVDIDQGNGGPAVTNDPCDPAYSDIYNNSNWLVTKKQDAINSPVQDNQQVYNLNSIWKLQPANSGLVYVIVRANGSRVNPSYIYSFYDCSGNLISGFDFDANGQQTFVVLGAPVWNSYILEINEYLDGAIPAYAVSNYDLHWLF